MSGIHLLPTNGVTDLVRPSGGRYRFVLGDGTNGTTNLVLYRQDAAGTMTPLVPAAYTNEDAQDAVGSILTDSASIDFTYDDAGGTITAAVMPEAIQDIVGALMADSATIDVTYNDAGNVIGIAVITTGLDLATITARGVMSPADKVAVNTELGKDATGANPTIFRPGNFAAGNTYDPTGATNSTSSFAACLAAMIAYGGRAKFEMPPGVFKVDPSVITGFANAPGSVKGSSRGATVLIPTSGAGDFITLRSGADGFEISDFAIYNTSGTPFTTNAGINTNGCNSVVIHDMMFVDLFYDVNVTGSSIKVSIQRTVHFQTNGSATSVGIRVANGAAGDTYIGPDVVMSNTGATRRRASVEILESGHFEINQCNLTGSQYGTYIDPAAGKIAAFGFINETLNDSCTVAGMRLSASTATSTIKNIKSTGSWYSGTLNAGHGVSTDGVAGGIINGITFSNDRMLNNGGHGFSHTFGTDFRWADCDMKGNSSTGTGGTANTTDGLNVAAGVSNWSINGGKYGGTDTAITGAQRFGIFVAAGAGDFIKISPDDVSGNTTGPISMGATGANVFMNGCPGLCPGKYLAADSPTTGTGATTLIQTRLPAGSVRVGTVLRIKLAGQSSSTGTLLASVRCGATNDAQGAAATNAAAYSTPASAAQVASSYAQYEFVVRVTAIGAAGAGRIDVTLGPTFVSAVAVTQATAARASGAGFLAVTTTADLYLSVAIACSVGTFTAITGTIEVESY